MKLQPWVKAAARDVGQVALALLAIQGLLGYLDKGIPAGDLAIIGGVMIPVRTLLQWAKARRAAREASEI